MNYANSIFNFQGWRNPQDSLKHCQVPRSIVAQDQLFHLTTRQLENGKTPNQATNCESAKSHLFVQEKKNNIYIYICTLPKLCKKWKLFLLYSYICTLCYELVSRIGQLSTVLIDQVHPSSISCRLVGAMILIDDFDVSITITIIMVEYHERSRCDTCPNTCHLLNVRISTHIPWTQVSICPLSKDFSSCKVITSIQKLKSSWWFQPIWKILVKLDHFPK